MRARASILLSALVLTLLTGTGTAAAHGDEGEMTVTRLEQVGPTTVEVEVGLVYDGDGHLAEDAQVSATLTGPGGASVGPVPLERTGEATSLYAATVEVPAVGDWTAAVTSRDPTAEASQAVTVTGQGPATTGAPGATAADATTTTETPAEVDTEPVTATQSAEDEESSSDLALLVGASLVLAVVVIGGAVLVARQRAAKDAADADGAS